MGRHFYKVRRGMIFWYEPPKSDTKTSVQQGHRPWLVVSCDEGNLSSPTCNIAPTTTEDKTRIPTHVKTWFNGQENTVLCEQVITVDQNALNKGFICMLTDEVMTKVEEALAIQYSIKPVVKYMDFNMTNVVEKLESMIGEIIKNKVQQQTRTVPYADLEDSALRLGQMIEDLVGVNVNNANADVCNVPENKVSDKSNSDKNTTTNSKSEQNTGDSQETPTKSVVFNPSKGKTKWTVEARCQFLRDCDSMTPEAVRAKYGFSRVNSVFTTKYNCKNILQEMGVDYKDEKITDRKTSDGD